MIKEFIIRKAKALTQSRAPDFAIGPAEDPYMLRWWWLPRNRFFNVYVHIMRHDDDDRALHDHPWPSLSLCAQGILLEHYKDSDGDARKRLIYEGDWIWRPASFAHRLAVFSEDELPMTIFITGPRIREWGFHCPKGWRHWMDFVSSDDKGVIGRGCGEMTGPSKAPKRRRGFFK